jgi:hypothetical protein
MVIENDDGSLEIKQNNNIGFLHRIDIIYFIINISFYFSVSYFLENYVLVDILFIIIYFIFIYRYTKQIQFKINLDGLHLYNNFIKWDDINDLDIDSFFGKEYITLVINKKYKITINIKDIKKLCEYLVSKNLKDNKFYKILDDNFYIISNTNNDKSKNFHNGLTIIGTFMIWFFYYGNLNIGIIPIFIHFIATNNLTKYLIFTKDYFYESTYDYTNNNKKYFFKDINIVSQEENQIIIRYQNDSYDFTYNNYTISDKDSIDFLLPQLNKG